MTHKECRECFVDALYGKLSSQDKEAFEAHLGVCDDCSGEFREMEETLRVMTLHKREEPTEQEWSGYWDRLSQKLEREGKKQRAGIFRLIPESMRIPSAPAWIYGAAAVLLIAIGFILGRVYFAAPHEGSQNLAKEQGAQEMHAVSEDSVSRLAYAYLQRSKNLLIGVINSDGSPGTALDYSQEQKVSRDLLEKGHVLEVALGENDQQHLLRLIKDLEVILLQLANTEIRPGVPVVELVKNGVDQKSILLKINLLEMERDAHRHQLQPTKKSS